MNVLMGGVRGSAPVAGKRFARYGGQTTSILASGEAGEFVLLDLGTGVRDLAPEILASGSRRVLILLTHYHLDHLMGLPALALLRQPGLQLVFAAPTMEGREIGRILPRLMKKPFWPLSLKQAAASITFQTLPEKPVRPLVWGGLRIRWTPVHHSEGCSAYRVDEPATGASFVLATDVEWPLSSESERETFLSLIARPDPVRLLLFDGQYNPASYERHRGWGHSRWTDAVDIGRQADIPRVGILHHSPNRTDAELNRLDRTLRHSFPGSALVRAGDRFRLSPAAAQ